MANPSPWLTLDLLRHQAKEEVRNKDDSAARELAKELAKYLHPSNQKPLPEPYRQFLYEALNAIATGADPAEVFYCKPPRGRPSNEDDSLAIAAEIYRSPLGRHKADGGAYKVIGDQFNKSPGAAEADWKKWRDEFELLERLKADIWQKKPD